ncbi:MAG: hypothetical protein SO179_00150 [Bacteroidales bacterium]|nr:hypothetical protein [Bacteroidales bacterium]
MKRKLLYFLATALLSISSIYAQDIITTRVGDEIQAKIIEIGANEIKYKKWTNQEGPTYTLTKTEIFMINYQNGEKEVFSQTNNQSTQINPQKTGILDFDSKSRSKLSLNGQRLSEYEAIDILGRHYYEDWVSGYTKRIVGKSLLWTGVGLDVLGTFFTFLEEGDYPELYLPCYIVGVASSITGWILWANGNRDMRYVINSFNDKHGNNRSVIMSFNSTQNGIGLTFTF